MSNTSFVFFNRLGIQPKCFGGMQRVLQQIWCAWLNRAHSLDYCTVFGGERRKVVYPLWIHA